MQKGNRVLYKNILIVSGSGRKCGKTTLIKQLISCYCKTNKITSIKISPHVHQGTEILAVIETPTFRIFKETTTGTKDSQLFLQAGAAISYYIETTDESLQEAFTAVQTLIETESLIICESGALATVIKPGILIFMDYIEAIELSDKKIAYRHLADMILNMNQVEYKDICSFVAVENNQWIKL